MGSVASNVKRTLWLILALALCSAPAVAVAATPDDTAASEPTIPLPLIPPMPGIELAPPTREAIQNVQNRLAQLAQKQVDDPLAEVDLAFLTSDLSEDDTSAIRQRVLELRDALDGRGAERALEQARKNGRTAIRKAKKALPKGEPEPDGDWLVFMLATGPDSEARSQAIELYGMLRMLEAQGTTAATREMIACYSYFGNLVRIDLQRSIDRLKDKAVPALLEAKQHDARKVRNWARERLDRLGRAIPGEAVSTKDPVILADVFLAFARVKDLEATRIILSFVNHDRVQLRRAARAAIGALGKPARGFFRNAYQDLTGELPSKDWDWERLARELFRLHDMARMRPVYEQMDQGRAAAEHGRYEDAVSAFDQVLARDPLFDGRDEMALAYFGRAKELIKDGQRDAASVALRKALRLDPKGANGPKIQSQIATLEGEALIEKGTPDRFILERAIALDQDNERAKELLASLASESTARQKDTKKYVAAIGIGILATILMLLIARLPRRNRKAVPEAAEEEP